MLAWVRNDRTRNLLGSRVEEEWGGISKCVSGHYSKRDSAQCSYVHPHVKALVECEVNDIAWAA